MELTLGRDCARLGLLKGLLEFPSLFYPELFFLGSALLKLRIAALHLFELGLQPGHLVLFFLELGLMRNLALLLFGCAEIAGLAYKIDTHASAK